VTLDMLFLILAGEVMSERSRIEALRAAAEAWARWAAAVLAVVGSVGVAGLAGEDAVKPDDWVGTAVARDMSRIQATRRRKR